MEDYMDHKQECLWVCNTHWVMNSNEKAIMEFQCANTLFFLHGVQTPCIPKGSLTYEQYNVSNSTWKITCITNKNAYVSVGIHIGSWIAWRKLLWNTRVQTPYSPSHWIRTLCIKHKTTYPEGYQWSNLDGIKCTEVVESSKWSKLGYVTLCTWSNHSLTKQNV